MKSTPYLFRYVAQITIECTTPLAVGSGESSFVTDAQVATDCNDMPYIPGTALAGVVRHALSDKKILEFWGKHDRGSQISFTEARMVGKDGRVLDGMCQIPNTPFYEFYRYLPIRQHTAITEKGVVKEHCKFDEQVVPKGTRFRFEIEMLLTDENEYDLFRQVINVLKEDSLRLGGGTRNGFGKLDVKRCVLRKYNLTEEKDLCDYIQKSSSLSVELSGGEEIKIDNQIGEDWIKYHLELNPVDFFMFGSGFGDEDVDDVPVKEDIVEWTSEGKAEIKKDYTLIPATSIKGALSHRVAYHYNKAVGNFADGCGHLNDFVGTKNNAVAALFGEDEDGANKKISRGNVLFQDLFLRKIEVNEHVFPHVKIDRFTGGTIDGALFQEKASFTSSRIITDIYVKKNVDAKALNAFERALNDLCSGALPLGGNVNKGHGCFNGNWEKK